jgi:uncharacterized protein (DUF1800 family)
MSTDPALIAHLYRRAGFGASAAEIAHGAAVGYDVTVDALLAGLSGPDPTGARPPHISSYAEYSDGKGSSYDQFNGLVAWWIERMATTATPLREKLTLLLHSQFPTGFSKVGVPVLMYRQNEIFRTLGAGSFETLTQAVARDPSMLIWLDTGTDLKEAPNENFARELMERFTMGIGNYTQEDVRQSARAFTGWSMSYKTGRFSYSEWNHDYGEKFFLGRRGDLSGEDIVSIVTNTPASHRFVASRMWSWLAFPIGPNHPIATELALTYAPGVNMTNLLRTILLHPEFVSSTAQQGLVKQPIEWVAGIFRSFRLRAATFKKWGGTDYIHGVMDDLGQTPFDPPTVGGWGANQFWLSTASSLAQLNFAQNVAQFADISPIADQPQSSRLEALADLLSIDSWSNESHAALSHVANNPPSLVSLGLIAPEYMVN